MARNKEHPFWATEDLWSGMGLAFILLAVVFSATQCTRCLHEMDMDKIKLEEARKNK